jgi:hypothetical protein
MEKLLNPQQLAEVFVDTEVWTNARAHLEKGATDRFPSFKEVEKWLEPIIL